MSREQHRLMDDLRDDLRVAWDDLDTDADRAEVLEEFARVVRLARRRAREGATTT